MRCFTFLFIMLGMSVFIRAQEGQNPFDLSSDKPTETGINQEIDRSSSLKEKNINPFDLANGNKTPETIKDGNLEKKTVQNTNPFDLGDATNTSPKEETRKLPIKNKSKIKEEDREFIQHEKQTATRGWVLGLNIMLLTLATFIFIFFNVIYKKIYKATLNNNQLLLLFRERKSGTIISFYIAYGLFFLSAGLFTYLILVHFNLLPEGAVVIQYGYLTLIIFSLFIIKHIILTILGYVFPIKSEAQLYSFIIMIFAILLGIILAFGNLVLAYATETIQDLILYFIIGIILIAYIIRSLRSIFIANRFIFNFPYHFLLYLCAVEIAPVLVLYKFFVGANE